MPAHGWKYTTSRLLLTICSGLLLSSAVGAVLAESDSTLTGRVIDPSSRIVVGAEIVVRDLATLIERSVRTNGKGIYEIRALQVGIYRMQVRAPGFDCTRWNL